MAQIGHSKDCNDNLCRGGCWKLDMDKFNSSSKAHVICCNDSVELVVVDNSVSAKALLDVLARRHYSKNPGNWVDYKTYRNQCYWHIEVVNCLK